MIGGFLTHNFGWRSIFTANIIVGIVIIYLVTVKLKAEWAEAVGERYDWPGNILYSVAFIFFMIGFSDAGAWWSYVLIAVGTMVMFAVRELKIEFPILNLQLFRITQFAFSNLAALINYSATFSLTFLLSLYLQDIKGFDPEKVGLILLAQPVMMASLSPYAGKLSDRIEPRIVASIGMGLTALGLLVFCFLGEGTPTTMVLAGLVVVGIGFALFSSPNTNAIMSSVERRFFGTASGLVGTMRLTGQLLSMGIATISFSHFLGGRIIGPETYPLFLTAVRVAFAISTTLCVVGVFASMARGRIRKAVKSQE